ncbi:hypothetical protein [Streptomyces sp. NBC_00503]|uniref:hypothetical protein n=1 Tax=Streptomyces sp. NBC_00503 TaxID=2903659 RepID=UPI002E804EDC|nr:hypothetical protein [Streptomyces sp. NBC_00503]WUD82791.1 hypothetical protein OG490_20810 [Streptomyces sp. NBC_00503]
MTAEPTPEDPAWKTKRRRAAIAESFAFFPGLPHVIGWGAIITSLAVGGLARWAWQSRMTRKHIAPR